MRAVDTNRDGCIDYSGAFNEIGSCKAWLKRRLEFRKFVEQTEQELWQLFKSIDRDHNGQLDKGEIRLAFERAGINLPGPKLDQFFSEVDSNHDGVITFNEWRYSNRSLASSIRYLVDMTQGTFCCSSRRIPQTYEQSFLTILPPSPSTQRGMCTYQTIP